MTTIDATNLGVGDVFYRNNVAVTVLRASEPCTDRFGQPLFRFWCSRADTGAEGWVTFGSGGVVWTSRGGIVPT
jgi:hypothetical protein